MKPVLKVKLLAALLVASTQADADAFKVTVLSASDNATYFWTGCTIQFESNVHHAFEATCKQRKTAHRPFQADPRITDYALKVNGLFFYNCELVGAWTASNPTYHGNRIFHCGALIP